MIAIASKEKSALPTFTREHLLESSSDSEANGPGNRTNRCMKSAVAATGLVTDQGTVYTAAVNVGGGQLAGTGAA